MRTARIWQLIRVTLLLAATLPRSCSAKDAVKLTGYINVSSHCQDPLLALLKELGKKYGDDLTMEIIDFGSAEGKKRWLGDGYRCLTLLLDGKPGAMIAREGTVKQVNFQMPPGLQWQMEDLKQAVAERVAALPSKRAKAAVTARKDNAGHEVGEVLLGQTVVLRYHATSGGKGAYERAKSSAERLKKLYLDRLTASEVQPGKRDGMWVIVARGETLGTATEPEAKLSKSSPEKLVGVWARNLQKALR